MIAVTLPESLDNQSWKMSVTHEHVVQRTNTIHVHTMPAPESLQTDRVPELTIVKGRATAAEFVGTYGGPNVSYLADNARGVAPSQKGREDRAAAPAFPPDVDNGHSQ